MNNFFTICCISILVSILGCSQKSVSEKDLLPQRPYDSESLMYADIPVEKLEDLMALLEERLNARTLTDYLAVESKIDRKLGFLLGAVSLETGIRKYGDPGFSDPALRATRVRYGFSRVRTKEHLQMAIHVVAHTKHLLEIDRN